MEKQDLIEYLKQMLRIRFFEKKIDFLFSRGLIHGTAHPCIGQEAIAVGACSEIKKTDFVTSNHRGHGHAIAKGLDITKLFMEFQGKKGGYCGGRGGTQHFASSEFNIFSNGVTGGCISLATGIAFSYKFEGKNNVVLCFFGDGATNEGVFHESLNIASIWKLPIIFLCENNLYAMSTPIKDMIAVRDIADRSKAYGISGEIVDGNNLLEVKEKVKRCVERARKGEGPSLIEFKTYRQKGHSKNDIRNYRTREEESLWEERDPIKRVEGILEEFNMKEKINKIKEEIKEEIDECAQKSIDSPEPDIEDKKKFLYYENERTNLFGSN